MHSKENIKTIYTMYAKKSVKVHIMMEKDRIGCMTSSVSYASHIVEYSENI